MINETNANNNKKHNIITIVCAFVSFIIVLVCALYFIFFYNQTGKKNPNTPNDNSGLSVNYVNPFESKLTPSYKNLSKPEGFNEKFSALSSLNSNVIGWISIPNLNIDDVVLATPSNTNLASRNNYYLKKDIFDRSNRRGSLFTDYRCTFGKDLFSKNTIIYGHTFEDEKSMLFAKLDEYRTIEGYQKSPVITFNTIYGDYKWKVVAAFTTTAYPEGDNGYNFNYFYPNMADERTEGFINEVNKRAFYFTNVDVKPTDKFLTLSTCCYDYVSSKLTANQGKGRLVVVARLVREGESEEVDTTNLKYNTNRYESQSYYTKHGKANPWPTPTWKPY